MASVLSNFLTIVEEESAYSLQWERCIETYETWDSRRCGLIPNSLASVSRVSLFLPSSLHQQLSRASSRFCTSKKMALIGQGRHYALRSNFIIKSLLQVTEQVLLPVGGTPPVVNEL